jgi:hypothetical protein
MREMTAYKMTEWESNGRWHCNDVQNLAGITSEWWFPARLLDLSLVDFVKELRDTYGAEVTFRSEGDKSLLLYSFPTRAYCKKFCKVVNNAAAMKKVTI